MNTSHTSLRRLGAGAATGALVASGLLLVGSPAQAAETVTNSDIAPDESVYAGWHQGVANAPYASAISSEGLSSIGKSQILYGYEDSEATSLTKDGVNADLSEDLVGASYTVAAGEAYFQVPLFVDNDGAVGANEPVFTTLRPATPATGATTIAANDSWVSSKAVGSVAANTPIPLSNIIEAIEGGESIYKTIGFGVFTDTGETSTVSSITFDGETYEFAADDVSSSTIKDSQVAVEETSNNYKTWHQGYENATGRQQVTAEGLELSGKSQVIKGFNNTSENLTAVNANLAGVIPDASYAVESGKAFFQIALRFDNGSGVKFATLRNQGAGEGTNQLSLGDDWQSSKAINGSIPANQDATLSDIVAGLGNYKVIGYGVLTNQGESAVVANVTFGTASTTFEDVPEAATTENVLPSQLAPNEDVFAGWHQGAETNTATIAGGRLKLGADKSQVINGYENNSKDTNSSNVDLAEALRTGSYTVAGGDVFFQVPVFFEDADGVTQFATLRPAVKAQTGLNTFSLGADWMSSRALGDLAANTPVQLGDLLSSIGSYKVLAFGVYSDAGGNGEVSDITWDGTKYTFANQGPSAAPVKGSVQAGKQITVDLKGSDPDGDALTYTAEGVNGTAEVNNEEGTLTFTAVNNFHGVTTFNYTVSDGQDEATSTVEINVGKADSRTAAIVMPETVTTKVTPYVDIDVDSTGSVTAGRVDVYVDRKLVNTGKTYSTGSAKLSLKKKLTKGKHTVSVYYRGTSFSKASFKGQTITVK